MMGLLSDSNSKDLERCLEADGRDNHLGDDDSKPAVDLVKEEERSTTTSWIGSVSSLSSATSILRSYLPSVSSVTDKLPEMNRRNAAIAAGIASAAAATAATFYYGPEAMLDMAGDALDLFNDTADYVISGEAADAVFSFNNTMMEAATSAAASAAQTAAPAAAEAASTVLSSPIVATASAGAAAAYAGGMKPRGTTDLVLSFDATADSLTVSADDPSFGMNPHGAVFGDFDGDGVVDTCISAYGANDGDTNNLGDGVVVCIRGDQTNPVAPDTMQVHGDTDDGLTAIGVIKSPSEEDYLLLRDNHGLVVGVKPRSDIFDQNYDLNSPPDTLLTYQGVNGPDAPGLYSTRGFGESFDYLEVGANKFAVFTAPSDNSGNGAVYVLRNPYSLSGINVDTSNVDILKITSPDIYTYFGDSVALRENSDGTVSVLAGAVQEGSGGAVFDIPFDPLAADLSGGKTVNDADVVQKDFPYLGGSGGEDVITGEGFVQAGGTNETLIASAPLADAFGDGAGRVVATSYNRAAEEGTASDVISTVRSQVRQGPGTSAKMASLATVQGLYASGPSEMSLLMGAARFDEAHIDQGAVAIVRGDGARPNDLTSLPKNANLDGQIIKGQDAGAQFGTSISISNSSMITPQGPTVAIGGQGFVTLLAQRFYEFSARAFGPVVYTEDTPMHLSHQVSSSTPGDPSFLVSVTNGTLAATDIGGTPLPPTVAIEQVDPKTVRISGPAVDARQVVADHLEYRQSVDDADPDTVVIKLEGPDLEDSYQVAVQAVTDAPEINTAAIQAEIDAQLEDQLCQADEECVVQLSQSLFNAHKETGDHSIRFSNLTPGLQVEYDPTNGQYGSLILHFNAPNEGDGSIEDDDELFFDVTVENDATGLASTSTFRATLHEPTQSLSQYITLSTLMSFASLLIGIPLTVLKFKAVKVERKNTAVNTDVHGEPRWDAKQHTVDPESGNENLLIQQGFIKFVKSMQYLLRGQDSERLDREMQSEEISDKWAQTLSRLLEHLQNGSGKLKKSNEKLIDAEKFLEELAVGKIETEFLVKISDTIKANLENPYAYATILKWLPRSCCASKFPTPEPTTERVNGHAYQVRNALRELFNKEKVTFVKNRASSDGSSRDSTPSIGGSGSATHSVADDLGPAQYDGGGLNSQGEMLTLGKGVLPGGRFASPVSRPGDASTTAVVSTGDCTLVVDPEAATQVVHMS